MHIPYIITTYEVWKHADGIWVPLESKHKLKLPRMNMLRYLKMTNTASLQHFGTFLCVPWHKPVLSKWHILRAFKKWCFILISKASHCQEVVQHILVTICKYYSLLFVRSTTHIWHTLKTTLTLNIILKKVYPDVLTWTDNYNGNSSKWSAFRTNDQYPIFSLNTFPLNFFFL